MAASSRPLQPLNISTARCLLRGDWETDDPASIIYYVTLARRAKLSLSLSLSFRSVVLHSFPPLSDGCIIAHYSYHEIWIIHSIERRDVWCRRRCDCNRDAVKDVPATLSLAFLLPPLVPWIDDNHRKNVNLRLTNVKSGKLTVRSIIW